MSYISVDWWKYALVAFADVEGNYLVVRAYQYTSITSVQLLDCFTIPCVMLLSRYLLKIMYTRQQVVGSVICIVGLSFLVVSDSLSQRYGDDEGSNKSRCHVVGWCVYACYCVCAPVETVLLDSLSLNKGSSSGCI